MTPEQFTALITALAVLIGAVSGLILAVRGYHDAVNSKMDVLMRLTASSSHAAGVAEGKTREAATRGPV